jgi:mannose/cellobiose epimerase-like protein (N-acyl-D-glucosamine 2-epimerase family)
MATEWTSLIHRMQRDRDNAKRRQGARKEIEKGLDNWWEEKTDGYLDEFDYEAYENAVIGWFETGYIDPAYLHYLRT